MAITDWPMAERPREKLLKQGPHTLSDAELLAIFLRSGCLGKSAVDLARDLLRHFGGLRELLEANQHDFCQAHGLGKAKYAQLQAVLEIAHRHLAEELSSNNLLDTPEQVRHYLSSRLRHRKREVFVVLLLDNRHRLLLYKELFLGTINKANVYPREVVKLALMENATSVILSHNHPSGSTEPSQADLQITRRLSDALALVDIKVLDHIIVGEGEVFAFSERGYL